MSWVARRYLPVRRFSDRVEVVRDALTGRSVVLKSAHDALERDALAREVRVSAASRHTAFRSVLDVERGWPPSRAVFELVEGTEVARAIEGGDDVGRIFTDVLCALEHLHRAGFVHGDLKPDHVLVDATGAARIIDLGLVLPLGAVPKGGTPRFMPPEYRAGDPVSASGDLYSLGVSFAPLVEGAGEDVREIVAACAARDPERRPASALACLSALGHMRRKLDVLGSFPLLGANPLLDDARALIARDRGDTLVIDAPPGSGVRRLARELHALALAEGRSVVALRLPADAPRIVEAAGHFERDTGEALRNAALVATNAARDGVVFVVIADEGAEPAFVAALSEACARARRGAFLVLGAPRETLVEAGSRAHQAPRARDGDVLELFSVAGARIEPAITRHVLSRTDGLMGVIAGLARAAEETPLRSEEDVVRAIDAATSAITQRAAPAPDVISIGADPDRARGAARQLAAIGRSADAAALLQDLGEASTDRDRLLLAQCLERLGDYRGAEIVARAILEAEAVVVRSSAAATLAHVSLALGRPEEAEDVATRALADAGDLAPGPVEDLGFLRRSEQIVGRLHTLRSDAALQRGRHREALAYAEHALAHARAANDPHLVAHACARVGGALSLAGRPLEAKDVFVEALRAAEEGGDLVVLPAFVMNLATAEHAASELAPAIEHYQEAARLARRFGRRANWLAAAINLAGLWVFVGADVEARRLLDEARAVADATGSAIYAGQETLIRAESLRSDEPRRARELARDAELSFERAGATRQALEARLLDAEIGMTPETARATLRFVDVNREELGAAGLGARASLLAARAHLEDGDPERGKHAAEASESLAAKSADKELRARALFVAAIASERLAPGSGAGIFASAKEELDAVARALPQGMRQRFLRVPSRREIATHVVSTATAIDQRRGLSPDARRILALVRRISSEEREAQILEAAVDEAVSLTGAERAFLLLTRPKGGAEVAVARNLDKETLRKSKFRFSRSVAERVLESGERIVTASATEDPDLASSRSILDLGLRSILCVPVPGRTGVLGALYLDHRYESGRFDAGEPELAAALADIVGVALQNARLLQDASRRSSELERHAEAALRESSRRAHEVERLTRALSTTRSIDAPAFAEGGIVGRSPALGRALDVVRRVAPSDLSVLIVGESGTGKELFARFVHDRSTRAAGPFVAINCGAVPENLLESELFGHVRGAFTGATRDHAGLFREADGGTIFLDEIGEMPHRMQTRLLRVLQEGEVRPVGGARNVDVDVRVVAATHRDLERGVREGTFREDLYYRLVGARVVLPALRERKEDIPDLCEAILARLADKHGERREPSRATYEALLRHDWPGNVRELEHTLTRGAILARGTAIEPDDLDLPGVAGGRTAALRDYDRDLVVQALRAAKGSRTEAARALGISRVTLHRWMKRYDVT